LNDLEIGGVRVSSPIWLAPLAGVTNTAFRAFHRRRGAGLVHTEMISAVGLAYKNKKTGRLIGCAKEPEPVVLQLFAPDEKSLVQGAAAAIEMKGFAALEVNMACPMPKVTKKGAGAKLLERVDQARRMAAALKMFGLPVWVKLRTITTDRSSASTEKFCEAMLDAGADLLLLHGRTPAQRYEGRADKKKVCETACRFPGRVAASGDYYSPSDAAMYLGGGCAAVLAARGVLRDACLIPKTLDYLGYDVPGKFASPAIEDQMEALAEIGRLGLESEGERAMLVLVRRMLPGLFKNFAGAAGIRQTCASCRDWPSLEKFLRGYFAAKPRSTPLTAGKP
jgi:tRNA-dihydrouridine synthase B